MGRTKQPIVDGDADAKKAGIRSNRRTYQVDGELFASLDGHAAYQREKSRLGHEFGNVEHPLRKQSYSCPKSSDEMTMKRKGLFSLAGNRSVFATGLADYAHALLSAWSAFAHEHRRKDGVLPLEPAEPLKPVDPRGQIQAEQMNLLFEAFFKQSSLITLSWQPIKPQSSSPAAIYPVATYTEDGVVLRGTQTFGSDALFVDELLVFIREEGSSDTLAHTIAVVPIDSEYLVVRLHPDFDSGVTVTYNAVLVPWSRVLVDRDTRMVKRLLHDPSHNTWADFQWASRQLAELELIAGMSFALADASGLGNELHIQGELGELVQAIDTMGALLHAAELGAYLTPTGLLLPAVLPVQAAKRAGSMLLHKGYEALQHTSGIAILDAPGIEAPEGSGQEQEGQQLGGKLLRGVWEMLASPQAFRRRLHEQYVFGDSLQQAQILFEHYPLELLRSRYREFWLKGEDTPC
ncbi:4-hydroxyphenylacetate 3-monooxygenase [Paenibacillus sp. 1_12]|uniref:4-hydroxyphenylacetate 3-hydroxylase C-terminal domain-containing protein n=1 Tax=Paenibacillus sp. 1_12 TaxID=1566278 RepID=UPI0008EFFB64|nr:4-hydroxyphenylacetate 3-hydroxylase C-terminal domain-containing protein [Paenibacillus sp. 1_12]SFM17105.1 4-hydroxyphenylacetate 3-monooxygenase [Paenibacillus sp. 1_12]